MSFWSCARLQARRENLAVHFLKLNEFETYCPRIRERRVRHGRWVEVTPPLFPGYCFVQIRLQWSRARWAPGVAMLLMDGNQPARVPDTLIEQIRKREVRGLVELPRPGLKRGDRVRITRGAFEGRLALFDGMKPHERVEVLLTLLGGAQRVTLAADAVEPAP